MKLLQTFLLCFYIIHSTAQENCTYPPTERGSVTDTIWHRVVEDPYRWLEDVHSEKTKEWLKGQEIIKDKYASKLADNVAEHLTNYSRIQANYIRKEGKYYFNKRTSIGNESSSLYYRETPEGQSSLLFNPNSLDKTAVINIDGYAISGDNKTLALILSKNGSDWKTIRFLDMNTRELLNDTIRFVKYSPIQWSGNGVFYIQYDVKDESESFTGQINIKALQYHSLGTSQKEDLAVYTPKKLQDDFGFEVTPLEKFLIIYERIKVNEKSGMRLKYADLPLSIGEINFKLFISSDQSDLYFNVVGELKDRLLVSSNYKAPNGAIYKCDPKKLNSIEKFIPQYKERLSSSSIINDNKIVALYNGDKRSFGVLLDSTGAKLKSWMIPEGFSFSGLSYSHGDSLLLYYFDSFFNPSSVYKMNLNTLEQEQLSKTIVRFSVNELTTEMVYYYSKDSTRIPMYLTHKKNMKLDGNNPTILYGYGGFGISTNPFYDVNNIAFLNSGGLFATPKLRGGGDFPGWHEQGMRLNKKNTFDDFIAAAEYLIQEKYTTSEKLAAMGGSNGGLLVGACMTMRPELFKVVVSQAGLLDMLRYHAYNIGYKYEREYGNITDSLDFENLITYSPVQNVRKGIDYPATLLVASDNDDRVIAFNSFKFLSQLQYNGSGKNPYVLYYVSNSGHSGSNIFDDRMKTKAYVYSFIYKYLGMEKKIYFED